MINPETGRVKYYFCELYDWVAYYLGHPNRKYGDISDKIISYTLEMINSFTSIENWLLYSDVYINLHGTISFDIENELNDRIAIELGEETFSYYVKETNVEPIFKEKMAYHYDSIIELKSYIDKLIKNENRC